MDLIGSEVRGFRGCFRKMAVEAGCRIVIPRRWRDLYPKGTWVGCRWPLSMPNSIGVFCAEGWEQRINNVLVKRSEAVAKQDRATAANLGKILAAMYRFSVDLQMDKVGRLCLGSELGEVIGLKDQCVLTGSGDFFKVFTPEGDAAEEERLADLSQEALIDLQIDL